MERSVYERMNALEAEHWWFMGRRTAYDWLREFTLWVVARCGP